MEKEQEKTCYTCRHLRLKDYVIGICLRTKKIAIENPLPSKIYELPAPSQVIQPYQFGHPYTKRTQLWLKGLPILQATNTVEPQQTWCPSGSYSNKHNEKHKGMFTIDRAKNRAKTFPGIARAMAEQWAGFAKEENNDR